MPACKSCESIRNSIYYLKNKIKVKRKRREYMEENPRRTYCHSLVREAKRKGWIKVPEKCPKCNESNSRIEAHHPDYFDPGKIDWVCSSCHKERTNVAK